MTIGFRISFTANGDHDKKNENSRLSRKRTTLGARQSGCLWEVVAYGKDQQNTPNTGLISIKNIHVKNITLAAKIRQIETNLFDFFTSIHSSDETLYNILEHITVAIPVYLQI